MQFFSRFFTTVQRSLTDVSFYKEMLAVRLRAGIGYLAKLLFALWFIEIAFFAATVGPLIPNAKVFLDRNLTAAQSVFPEGLEVTIDGGTLSTNQEGRVTVPFPKAWADVMFDDEDTKPPFTMLAAIDTSATAEDYRDIGALVLLTKTSAVFPDKNTGLRIVPFSDFDLPPGFTIDKEMVDGLANGVRPMLASVQPMLWGLLVFCVVILPFLLTALSLLGKLLWLLSAALLLLIFAKARGFAMTYGQIYRLSVYGLTPVILVSTAASLVSFPFGFWLSLVVFLAFMGYVITQIAPKAGKKRAKAA